jgi:proteic killer suppression protein
MVLQMDMPDNARKKPFHIQSAIDLKDLRIPPGNKLHALKGNRKEQFSISINDQWRICFRWKNGSALDVEIVDYH